LLCQKHGLTAYDAAYLEVALREECPLATMDNDLRRAAIEENVSVL
jgi:predicted nucleic acid-binding protein